MNQAEELKINRPHNATLQDRILPLLKCYNFQTVTALSDLLETNRSSTSRAINALCKTGMCRKNGGVWELTEAGKAEILVIDERILRRTKLLVERLDRLQHRK